MTHEELKEKIHLYHDHELSPADLPAVEAHLSECSDCREELRRWKELSTLLSRSQPDRPVDADLFVKRVMARIPRSDEREFIPRWYQRNGWWIPALASAAAVIVLFVMPARENESVPLTDTILLSGQDETIASGFSVSDENMRVDKLLGYSWEEL